WHDARRAASRARASAGSNMAARMPMMAITTSSSIRVKPRVLIKSSLNARFPTGNSGESTDFCRQNKRKGRARHHEARQSIGGQRDTWKRTSGAGVAPDTATETTLSQACLSVSLGRGQFAGFGEFIEPAIEGRP